MTCQVGTFTPVAPIGTKDDTQTTSAIVVGSGGPGHISTIGKARDAIDRKVTSLGGSPGSERAGSLNFGLDQEGNCYFAEYYDGSNNRARIYSEVGSEDAFLVYGAILERYIEMGGAQGSLGGPRTDELPFLQGGRVSRFQNAAIYFWPDVGAIAINKVALHYTGLHCFEETERFGF